MTPNQSDRRDGNWLSPIIHLSSNWVSLAGVVIVTTATVFWLFLLPTTLRGTTREPLRRDSRVPGAAGAVLRRPDPDSPGNMAAAQARGRSGLYPPINFRRSRGATPNCAAGLFRHSSPPVNLAIASQVSYGAVNYMDSVTFCGQTCHTVMQPEYTAYQQLAAFARGVREMPHRSRRFVVRAQQAVGCGQVLCGNLPHLSDGPSPRRSTTCARRGKPAKPATGRRNTARTVCGSSTSLPTTPPIRSPRPCC
jgi:hypothetical protein